MKVAEPTHLCSYVFTTLRDFGTQKFKFLALALSNTIMQKMSLNVTERK
jgi:hypothetical protein